MFLGGWIVSGAMWNFGRWPFYAAVVLIYYSLFHVAVSWRLSHLPTLRDELRNQGPAARRFHSWCGPLPFVLACFILADAQIISWDRWAFPYNPTLADVEQRLKGSEHRLIRELKAFREEIPTVELVMHEGISHVRSDNIGELVFYWLIGLGAGWVALLSRFATRKYKWTWNYHWKPSLSVTTSLFVALLLLTALTHFTGTTAHVRGEVRCDADAEQVAAAVAAWVEEHGYHVHSDGQWLLQTVPEGMTVGSLRLVQVEKPSAFDRWRIGWGAIQARSPVFQIQSISSANPAETIVRVEGELTELGPGAAPRHAVADETLSSLKSALDALSTPAEKQGRSAGNNGAPETHVILPPARQEWTMGPGRSGPGRRFRPPGA